MLGAKDIGCNANSHTVLPHMRATLVAAGATCRVSMHILNNIRDMAAVCGACVWQQQHSRLLEVLCCCLR